MPKSLKTYFEYKETKIPAHIHFERRNNARCSFGKKQLIIRLPCWFSKKKSKKQIENFIAWAVGQMESNPKLEKRYCSQSYQDGEKLRIMAYDFVFSIHEEERKSSRGVLLDGRTIKITLARSIEKNKQQDHIRTLTSRVMAQFFHQTISDRVHYWNDKFFQEPFENIRLKYNKSNWGSCSAQRNINLSTRILLAPKRVQDYVIVHELAHLKELNHGVRFWSWVEKAYPDYKSVELLLKEQGAQYDFK